MFKPIQIVTLCSFIIISLLLPSSILADIVRMLSRSGSDRMLKLKEALPSELHPLLEKPDSCGTISGSAQHGYLVRDYDATLDDGYKISMHRIVHPEDIKLGAPPIGKKKPYLLIHGLIGSSASFVRNIAKDYMAPSETQNVSDYFGRVLSSSAHRRDIVYPWSSVAKQFQAEYDGDGSFNIYSKSLARRLLTTASDADVASFVEVNLDTDKNTFARDYRLSYYASQVPTNAKRIITNSLAYTLSNAGYDVWLVNLRGNAYSSHKNGNVGPEHNNYWNFDLDQIVDNDIRGAINMVKQVSQYDAPIGVVAYSYSSLYLSRLLTKSPSYAETLRPIVLMAPAPQSSPREYGVQRKIFRALVNKGTNEVAPFPGQNLTRETMITKAARKLPLAGRIRDIPEMFLHGQVQSLGDFVLPKEESGLVQSDMACGQTSTKILRKFVDFSASDKIDPSLKPGLSSLSRNKRTVIIINARDDPVSTPKDIKALRENVFGPMTLANYQVEDSGFVHGSFLFSKRNQYLVNGEILKLVSLFDSMDPLYLRGSPTQSQQTVNSPRREQFDENIRPNKLRMSSKFMHHNMMPRMAQPVIQQPISVY